MRIEHPSLLCSSGVTATFSVKKGLLGRRQTLTAVDGVDLQLHSAECLGLVGESGCGKSTLGRLCAGLLAPTAGTVFFDNRHLPLAGAASWAAGRIQMIFQDPFSSLNPRRTVGTSVAEPLAARGVDAKTCAASAEQMLATVGLEGVARRYPHEFSGGQRQRIAIARALITNPDVVICDEPVSALDCSVQAQVLNLLCDLQERFRPAYLFISHDLHVVGFMCQRILVMYLGRIVEEGPKEELLGHAAHPYTQALLAAHSNSVRGVALQGELPSPFAPPTGCPFHPRCPKAVPICATQLPPWQDLGPMWRVRCHRFAD